MALAVRAGNDKKAIEWHTRAAEQGNAKAQIGLGVMYKNGQGVLQDDLEAYAWAIVAASNGQRQLLDELQSGPQYSSLRLKAQARAKEINAKIESRQKLRAKDGY